ncbi:sucC [Wigglesworthia glossinidia endosymbiont of Glossina brevipalpis]|uniref:Succinate--CoA ligase [ADP-forming] subunit beta n=1 Tax=Wigglesworthia glossinidia brevipalpis TaxID=36870 RepID=Q8D2D7_WIGBR|nr:sucC [Wigglesworthia glossinidia endosymbiont of Glossina brevipalpis]
MNLHEYQAKKLFNKYEIPIPKGYCIKELDEIEKTISNLSTGPWVIKCQIHAGGRGKSGGIKITNSKKEIHEFAKKWLGNKLITYQTDKNGQKVNYLLIEKKTIIKKELYLSFVINRKKSSIMLISSDSGGVDIENIFKKKSNNIYKEILESCYLIQDFQSRKIAFKLGLQGNQINQFVKICNKLSLLFLENDLTTLEINPIVIDDKNNLICLDGKIIIDDNAIYRNYSLYEEHDNSQLDKREVYAANDNLNYIPLDGNIGCMVNGAGLAMGTMDLIKFHGGNPANFLDVGGNTTVEKVEKAFKIILLDSNVKVILVNIFGGIVRCDLISNGIINSVINLKIKIPIIVRLEGNNSINGIKALKKSNLNIIAANSLNDAVKKAIKNSIGKHNYVDFNR